MVSRQAAESAAQASSVANKPVHSFLYYRGMASATMIPVEEYLRTCYRPDCDYVDGQVLERNVGELEHSDLQGELIVYLRARRKQWGIRVYPEMRVRVAPRRYRIPDICGMLEPVAKEPIFTTAPVFCIEILSREDRWTRVRARIDDFLAMGVRYVWAIDPLARRAWQCEAGGKHEIHDLVLRTTNPDIEIPLREIFTEIDS